MYRVARSLASAIGRNATKQPHPQGVLRGRVHLHDLREAARDFWMRSFGIVLATSLLAAAPSFGAAARRRPAPARKTPVNRAPRTPVAPKIVAPEHPQFLRDVAPILDKKGCSVAA